VLERIELSEALKGRGCPFCQVAAQAGRRYLRHFLHELVLDGGLRLALHRSGGFCRDHAWELQRLEVERWHDNMGTATVYEDLARAVARTIRTRPVEAGRPRWFRHRTPDRPPLTRALVPAELCPACASVRFHVDYLIDVFVRSLEHDDELRALFRASFGLCLPHFRKTVDTAASASVRRMLAEVEAQRLEALADELASYVLKLTVGHQDEPKGDEQTSPVRIIELFVGKAQ